MNVQLMCNAECKIITCVVKWPGSTRDSRISNEGEIFKEFKEGRHKGIILGDSGYPVKRWLMIPVLAPKNRAEERYSSTHCVTRRELLKRGALQVRLHCLDGPASTFVEWGYPLKVLGIDQIAYQLRGFPWYAIGQTKVR